jgi:hypothetical protein
MLKYLITFALLFCAVFVSAQSIDHSIFENEKQQLERTFSLSKSLYPGDLTIDAKYYKLDLTLSYSPNYLKGSVQIDAVPFSQALNSFFLDLSNNLQVDSVISNNSVLTFTHQNDKLMINLPRVYQPNEKFSVVVFYRGVTVQTVLAVLNLVHIMVIPQSGL